MTRRTFLTHALAALAAPRLARGQSDAWRTFAVTTRVDIPDASGLTRAWLPLAHAGGAPYQRVLKQTWRGSARTLRAIRDGHTGTGILYAEWPDGGGPPHDVELTLHVAVREPAVVWSDLTAGRQSGVVLRRHLQPIGSTTFEGLSALSRRITGGEPDDLGRARAIYDWVVDSGKGSDLNVLFVQLVRAAGVPARNLVGLGLADGDVTASQQSRAEFLSRRHGWVPVDPAGARREGRDEYVRRLLFGAWKGAWLAFNDAHDVQLPGSDGPPVAFLARPEAETRGARRDSLDSTGFRYRIVARPVAPEAA